MSDDRFIKMLEAAIVNTEVNSRFSSFPGVDMPPPAPLTPQDFYAAVAKIQTDVAIPRGNVRLMHPRQWAWYKWAMEQLGVTTLEEVDYALLAEDRFFAYLRRMGWRGTTEPAEVPA